MDETSRIRRPFSAVLNAMQNGDENVALEIGCGNAQGLRAGIALECSAILVLRARFVTGEAKRANFAN